MIKSIAKIIKLSKWFHRKSQHYIMGDWAEYAVSDPEKAESYKRYKRYYLQSYIRFMWLCRNEIINA
jgi:hypothetical protein